MSDDTAEMFSAWIEEARQRFGDPPRQFPPELWYHWQVTVPGGVMHDPRAQALLQLYRDRDRLMHEGFVVWGAVLAANGILYEPGIQVAPGFMLYSPHAHYDSNPLELLDLVDGCYEARDHGGPRELRRIMAIADRMFDFRMGEQLHPEVTEGRPVFFTSIVFHRKHLPKNWIVDPLLPLVVDPANTSSAWLLPVECWPEGLLQVWEERAAEQRPQRKKQGRKGPAPNVPRPKTLPRRRR